MCVILAIDLGKFNQVLVQIQPLLKVVALPHRGG